jgi:signal transduction histidine kinase/ActR/RegA family two-component response regulator
VKLQRQLILLVLAALLPLVVLSAVLGSAALRQAQKEMERAAVSRVTIVAAAVERELRAESETLQTLAVSPRLDDTVDAAWFHAYARRLLEIHPRWLNVAVVDAQGRRLVSEPELPDNVPRTIPDMEALQRAVRTKAPAVGRIFRINPRVRPAFALFAPVVRHGQVRHVLQAIVEPERIEQLLTEDKLPQGWISGVVDRGGRFLASSIHDVNRIGAEGNSDLRKAAATGGSGLYTGTSLGKRPYIGAYRTLPGSGWSVHITIPREIYGEPARGALWLVAGGAAVSLGLMALFLGLLTREMQLRQRESTALEESRRLEALGRITGGVAHDFNNILMIVQGSAELLKRRLAGEPKTSALVDAILSGAQRGQALTRQLLAVGRRSSHEPVTFLLRDLAGELSALLQRTLPADIVTELELYGDTWPIHVDPRALEVALINLAVNARDAMATGGALTISAANVVLQKGRDEGTGLTGEFVALSVADTGVGIAEAHLGHVFEPFYTTKAAGKGTGLGLSQVYGFAKQSHGAVTVRSRLGEGATVTLYLPRSRQTPVKPAPSPVEEVVSQQGRILLVEDNAAVAEAIDAMLTALGLSVERASDGAAALERLKEDAGFDLMLSDIMMDGMSGLELSRRVREMTPELPIVLMTGYSEALVGSPMEDDIPLLAKPFGPAELTAAIGRARLRQPAPQATPASS